MIEIVWINMLWILWRFWQNIHWNISFNGIIEMFWIDFIARKYDQFRESINVNDLNLKISVD